MQSEDNSKHNVQRTIADETDAISATLEEAKNLETKIIDQHECITSNATHELKLSQSPNLHENPTPHPLPEFDSVRAPEPQIEAEFTPSSHLHELSSSKPPEDIKLTPNPDLNEEAKSLETTVQPVKMHIIDQHECITSNATHELKLSQSPNLHENPTPHPLPEFDSVRAPEPQVEAEFTPSSHLHELSSSKPPEDIKLTPNPDLNEEAKSLETTVQPVKMHIIDQHECITSNATHELKLSQSPNLHENPTPHPLPEFDAVSAPEPQVEAEFTPSSHLHELSSSKPPEDIKLTPNPDLNEEAKSLETTVQPVKMHIIDQHECITSNATHELKLSQSPNLHENPTPHPLPEFDSVRAPEPQIEAEFTPSSHLHELSSSKPPEDIKLTPNPDLNEEAKSLETTVQPVKMHIIDQHECITSNATHELKLSQSPNLHENPTPHPLPEFDSVRAPEPQIEAEFTPSSHLHELSSSKPPEDIKLTPNPDLNEEAKSLETTVQPVKMHIIDQHECITSNATHELKLSQSPNLHENPTPHPLPEFDSVRAPEPQVEAEFTPSSHLHELSSSKPPEDIKLTPNPDLNEEAKSLETTVQPVKMHIIDQHECITSNATHELKLSQSPNLHENPTPHPLPEFDAVSAPEPQVEAEFTPSSHLHELSSSKPPEDIKLTPNPDLYERPFPKLQDEIELAPIGGTNTETPEPTKITLPTNLTENTRNVADENDANTSKPEGAHSSEIKEIELEAADQEILECETAEPSQKNKVTTSPESSEGTPEPIGVKWKLPARKMLPTTENIQKKIEEFKKKLGESSNMEPTLELRERYSEPVRPSKRTSPSRTTPLPSIATQTKHTLEPVRPPKRGRQLLSSDNESEAAEEKISESPTPELIDEIEQKYSPETRKGSSDSVGPPKRSRPSQIKILPTLLTEMNRLVTEHKKYASLKQKGTKSYELGTSESDEAERDILERHTPELTDEIERTSSAEPTEGSSGPVRAPKRPIKLIPQLLAEIQELVDAKKDARSSEKKINETSNMRDIDSEKDLQGIPERYTPEPIDDFDLSQSPLLREGTEASPEPIRPPKRKKLTRSEGRTPEKKTQLFTERLYPMRMRRSLYSPSAPGTSSGALAYAAQTLAGPSTTRARPSVRSDASLELQRTVPHTTASETGSTARQTLRNPERKGSQILASKISKRRIRIRTARRRQTQSESDSSLSGNDSSNDGSSCSGGSGGSGGNRGLEGHVDVGQRDEDIVNTAEEVPNMELDKSNRSCILM